MDRKAIETSIRELFAAGSAAWNRGDLDGYLAGYWESPKTRWASGTTVLRGKDAIAAAFRARFPSSREMGTFEASELEIEVLTDADALVFGHWVHTVGERVRRGVFTVHLRKIAGAWVVVSDHTSATPE